MPREVPEREKTIDQLPGDADFACEFRSRGTPPVTVYLATHAGDHVEIEFITTAQGEDLGVRTVQNGLIAQELRYVDLLLEHIWPLPLDVLSDGELEGRIWVPTPAAFILQKALSRRNRSDARPGTAYSGLDDDQFRQYAWSVMQILLEMMREGQAVNGT